MAMTPAEKQRAYRERLKSDPERLVLYRESDRERTRRWRAGLASSKPSPKPASKPSAPVDSGKGGYIYLIEAVGTEWVKVGVSGKNPASRLRELQTGCPFTLKLLWCYWHSDPYRIERGLHEKLDGSRCPAGNEFFSRRHPVISILLNTAELLVQDYPEPVSGADPIPF